MKGGRMGRRDSSISLPFACPCKACNKDIPEVGRWNFDCLESIRFQSCKVLKMITILSTLILFLSLRPYTKGTAITCYAINSGSSVVFRIYCPSCNFFNSCAPSTFNKKFREGIMKQIPPEQVDALQNRLNQSATTKMRHKERGGGWSIVQEPVVGLWMPRKKRSPLSCFVLVQRILYHYQNIT